MSPKVPIPRTMLRVPEEAAASMGVSVDFFDKHVRADLPLIHRGALILVRPEAITQWGMNNEAKALG
jgi:hypothetical protein